MYRHIAWAFAAVLIGCAASAAQEQRSPNYEQVVREMVTALERIGKALAAVTDAAKAEEARPALKSAVEQFVKARGDAAKLKQPDKAERDRVIAAYRERLARAVEEYQAQVRRVRGVPGGRELLGELKPLEAPKKNKQEKEKK